MKPRLTTLKPRVTAGSASRLATLKPGSWRTDQTTTAERGYGGAWQRARLHHLRIQPLCRMCKAMQPQRITVATVVDHIKPHRGNQSIFWDETNWQSLCAHHHSSAKQRDEGRAG